MTNQISVVAQGIRTQLLTHATLPSLVSGRIFLTNAILEDEMPYIRMVHLYGGDENVNPKRSFDIVMRVDAVTRSQGEAETLADYIDEALAGIVLTLPGYTNWTPTRQMFPFNDTILVTNNVFYSFGAQYRVRGV